MGATVSAATSARSDRSSSRRDGDHGVYVLELPGAETFAFAAASATDAEEVARAAWFAKALNRFASRRSGAKTASNGLRVATAREARAYQEFAEEFADEASGILVAYLGRARDR